MIKPLWAYRAFILGSVIREFQSKYRNSLLGAVWTIINPLTMIFIYTVIFSQVMRARLPGVDTAFSYSIYLCAGILTWGLFAEITMRAQNIFLEHANLLKKMSFPRLCLPVTMVINALINFGIVFGFFSLFLMISGNFPGWPYLAMLPLLVIQVAFAIGLGISLGVLHVFFRDVGLFFGVIMQFWFWLTPIVYSTATLPEFIRPWLALNPMTNLMTAYQAILLKGYWPEWQTLWPITVLALLLCVLALHLFRKHGSDMVDEL
ncbi:MAG: ABC transporter permease [Legionella sp.]|nr:ABC transporter permease [Legionella sp.]